MDFNDRRYILINMKFSNNKSLSRNSSHYPQVKIKSAKDENLHLHNHIRCGVFIFTRGMTNANN